MISKLAEEIYGKSIQLKKYDTRKLLFKRNRIKLFQELKDLQAIIDSLLSCLHSNSSFSSDYTELAIFMQKSLCECMSLLTSRGTNYRETVRRYIWGFHNLPRAFLSADNSMRISPNEAMEYYKPYLKLD